MWKQLCRINLNHVVGYGVHIRAREPPPFRRHPFSTSAALPRLHLQSQAARMSTTTTQALNTSITTRFLIISDTHSASPAQNATQNDIAFRPPLPRADVLLHCGDLTMLGHLHEYEKTLDMLESIDADLKLVIAGNHDISLVCEHYMICTCDVTY